MSYTENLFAEAMTRFERCKTGSRNSEIRELAHGLQQLTKALLEQHEEFDRKLDNAHCAAE